MTHLLDRIAAFIDGELSDEERERAMVHLAGCAPCRAEVAAHRAVKARLTGLATPEPSATLMAALSRLAEPGEPLPPPPSRRRQSTRDDRPATVGVGRRRPRTGDRPAAASTGRPAPAGAGLSAPEGRPPAEGRPAVVGVGHSTAPRVDRPATVGVGRPATSADRRPASVGADRRPASFGGARRAAVGGSRSSRSRHRLRVLASTAIFGATATLVTAFAVGGSASEAPPLTPDTASYLVEHARTSRGVPFAELPAGAVDASFQSVSRR